MTNMIYLDNAATSLKKPMRVYRELMYRSVFCSANAGRGAYAHSLKALNACCGAAESIAALFGIGDPSRIAFTGNATLALNMAIHGILKNGGHAVISSLEHNSVLRPLHGNYPYTVVPACTDGITDADAFERCITSETRLVICTHISNVCGSIQPVAEICAAAHRRGIPALIDGAQSAGSIPVDIEKLGADIYVFSGHKGLLGPLGTGGIYVKEGITLTPLVTGGTGSMSESPLQPTVMPDMLQSGTLNTPAISALGAAAEYVSRMTPDAIHAHESSLAHMLAEDISVIPGIKYYGTTAAALKNGTVAFEINGISSYEVARILWERYKIAVRPGLHCAPLAHKHFGTLRRGLVRASFGIFNSVKDEKKLVRALQKTARGRA